MATNIKIRKIVKNSKMNRFQWKWIFTGYYNKKILVTVTQSATNVPQTNNTSTSGMNEE
jgi:hypothetical protein